jgi:rhodanese-related sulfurtransferase
MKKIIMIFLLSLTMVACGGTAQANTELNAPITISASTGKSMMDRDSSIILIDVRTKSEYDEAHIEGAILLPLDTISSQASKIMKDKFAIYIIYCRSGNRSAQAVLQLYQMGYVNLYDMGGIINWPYGTISS